MKRTVWVALFSLVLLWGTAVHAQTSTDDVVTALQSSPVYVAPGTENTNPDTAGVLQQQLKPGDNIIIVMLPSNALTGQEGGVNQYLIQLDTATGGKYIIGLAVGDNITAYSAILPAGEATDLMTRARSVSTTSSETLGTFVRNVHDWQRRNPQEYASQPINKASDSFPVVPAIAGGSLLLVIAVFVTALIRRSRRRSLLDPNGRLKFKKSPESVRVMLDKISELRKQVDSNEVRAIIRQFQLDTEAFFSRVNLSRDDQAEQVRVFRNNLEAVQKVLIRYIDVQDNTRYWDNPQELLASGEDAFSGFAEYVLNNIKQGGRRDLTDFRVDTKILSAQRYT